MNAILTDKLRFRQRRGTAVAIVMLLILSVTGLGLAAISVGTQEIQFAVVGTDSSRALNVADACAAGAVKALPSLLETYILLTEWLPPSALPIPIVPAQFDSSFFANASEAPFGSLHLAADCEAFIIDIADDEAAPGYSEGGGCFKRVTLRVTGWLRRTGAASSDILQQQARTEREIIVRGIFGPIVCK
jgi:hypothetical protein